MGGAYGDSMTPYFETELGKLYHGDCLEIMPQLEPVDLVLTDPQYQLANGKKANIKNKTAKRSNNFMKGIVVENKDWETLQGDNDPFDPTHLLLFDKIILWGAIHYANRLPNSTTWLVWDKRNGVKPDDNADCEFAWSNIGGPARIHYQLWKGICRQGAENISIQGSKFHPFQKPVALMMRCLDMVGDVSVIDPYMGSGTTAIACERLNRKWIGIEIEEKYCEIAAKRIELERKQRKWC